MCDQQTATVKYQVATYSGTVRVNCHPDDEHDYIIAKAKRLLTRQTGGLPYGSESWKITERN